MTQQALDAGAEVVFACGGDGTMMACAAVLAGTQAALAVLPAGTGNLLANNLDLPRDVAAGVALATDGHRRRIDIGAVQDADTASGHVGRFTLMAGMGFDAQLLDSTPEGLKKRIGWLAYVAAALRHLRHRPISVRIAWTRPTRSVDGSAPSWSPTSAAFTAASGCCPTRSPTTAGSTLRC